MLSMRNCGKYLSKTWYEDRTNAMQNSDSTDQEFLELTDVQVRSNNDEIFIIDSQPYEPTTSSKPIDVRDRNGCK